MSEVAYQMFREYANKWGDKYVTSNVKVYNETTGDYEYVGATYRYFTTAKGLRIMAFGVLFDFTGKFTAVFTPRMRVYPLTRVEVTQMPPKSSRLPTW